MIKRLPRGRQLPGGARTCLPLLTSILWSGAAPAANGTAGVLRRAWRVPMTVEQPSLSSRLPGCAGFVECQGPLTSPAQTCTARLAAASSVQSLTRGARLQCTHGRRCARSKQSGGLLSSWDQHVSKRILRRNGVCALQKWTATSLTCRGGCFECAPAAGSATGVCKAGH